MKRNKPGGIRRRADAMQPSPPRAEKPARRHDAASGPVMAALEAAQSVAGSLLAAAGPPAPANLGNSSGRVGGGKACPLPDQHDNGLLALSDGTRIRFSRAISDETLEPI